MEWLSSPSKGTPQHFQTTEISIKIYIQAFVLFSSLIFLLISSCFLSVCILSSFCWKTDKSARGLTITPAKGFIRPGMEIPLDITFAPVMLSEDIRYEVSCAIGSSSVVGLTATGSCIVVSTNKEVRPFRSTSLDKPLHNDFRDRTFVIIFKLSDASIIKELCHIFSFCVFFSKLFSFKNK